MIRNFITLVFIFFVFTGCESTTAGQEASKYDQICKIYGEIVKQPITPSEKDMKIAIEIKKQFPVFFEENFKHIGYADIDRKYDLFKKLAEFEGYENWQCDNIKMFYEGGYDKNK